MPNLAWSAFIDRFPAEHLVVGVVPKEEGGGAKLRRRLELLARVLGRLGLNGSYALVIDRNGATPEIHCAFEREVDAGRVAEALQTTVCSRYPGWRRQREFGLDRAAVKTIEAVLRQVEQ